MGSAASSKNLSTSSRLQAAVPGVSSMAAPAAFPKRTDLMSDQPRLRPTVIAATIASPAPTPLTAVIGIDENRWLACRVANSAP
ncbi:Uncharacterised protein [Mycobacterium tuberculosis]|uniref:Uncharacterized protein n=1 Tax=Mycobacterium tuberculosis TaxID=1773 RepID=A0A655AQ45_MYCTX|nr:Uncharacterised protein [Mycobacterium tuberculosis]